MELGNLVWNTGNKNQRIECPLHITALLGFIKRELERIYWNIHQEEVLDIFSLYMDDIGFEIKRFEWKPYNWNDDEVQDYNFKYKDIEISWYKYFGRDMTINKEISTKEAVDMFNDIINEVFSLEDNEE